MSGINTGILTNDYPLSTGRIKELEKQVLESKDAFAYLDENSELCFAIPSGVAELKDLAWHNAYELYSENGTFTKKVYRKTGLKVFEHVSTLTKSSVEDPWETTSQTFLAPGLYETGAVALAKSGDLEGATAMLKKSWADLETENLFVVSEGYQLPENLPEQNEYGFYFDVSYSKCFQGAWSRVTLKEDGSVIYDYDGEIEELPAGSAVYSDHYIDLSAVGYHSYTVSDDGTILRYVEFPSDLVMLGTYAPAKGTLWAPTYSEIIGDLVLPENYGITSLGPNLLFDQKAVTAVHLPKSLKTIGLGAFDSCDSIVSIDIPEGVTSIESEAFCSCDNLTSLILPKGITTIEYAMVHGCAGLTSINIPEGVTSIDDWAFSYCYSLTDIVIPEGVISIGEGAFEQCKNLQNVSLPHSLRSVGIKAFWGCPNLTIRYNGTGDEWHNNVSTGIYWQDYNAEIFFTDY
jgi:hypothetical protein